MENCGVDETAKEITMEVVPGEAHPYAFHVSGPRNVSSPNWRDLISSSWSVPISITFSTSIICLQIFLF